METNLRSEATQGRAVAPEAAALGLTGPERDEAGGASLGRRGPH